MQWYSWKCRFLIYSWTIQKRKWMYYLNMNKKFDRRHCKHFCAQGTQVPSSGLNSQCTQLLQSGEFSCVCSSESQATVWPYFPCVHYQMTWTHPYSLPTFRVLGPKTQESVLRWQFQTHPSLSWKLPPLLLIVFLVIIPRNGFSCNSSILTCHYSLFILSDPPLQLFSNRCMPKRLPSCQGISFELP